MAGASGSNAASAAESNNANGNHAASSTSSVAADCGSTSTTSPSGTAHVSVTGAVSAFTAIPTPRKFLCAAPRPEQWESYGDQVLRPLGSKASAVLEETAQKVRSLHQLTDNSLKIGPGRKSNSVQALLFYQYLLDRVKNENPNSYNDEREDHDMDDDDNDQEDGNSEGEEDEASSSMDIDDFIAQHNDVCEVCEEQQHQEQQQESSSSFNGIEKLLLCSTCNLAFHLHCVRPVMEEWPAEPDQWRCAYCVLSTEPKNTKPRRVAAAAVRLMARMRNQRKRTHKKGGGDATMNTPKVHRERVVVNRKVNSSNKKSCSGENDVDVGLDCTVDDDDHDDNNDDTLADNESMQKKKLSEERVLGEPPSGEKLEPKSLKGGSGDSRKSDLVSKRHSPSAASKPPEAEEVLDDESVVTPKGGTKGHTKKPSPKAIQAISSSSSSRDHHDEKVSGDESASPTKGGSHTKRSPKSHRASASRDADDKVVGEKAGDDVSPSKSSDTNKNTSPIAARTRSSGDVDDDKCDSKKQADLSAPASGVGTPSCASAKKRSLELLRIADTLSPSFKLEDGGLGKRVRKQPTLYNPQTVPASLWKSDEFPAATSSRDDNDSASLTTLNSHASATNDAKSEHSVEGEREGEGNVSVSHNKDNHAKEAPKETTAKVRRGRSRTAWCNFCGDDPGIKICCFCACRVCFGKQAKKKLLICSNCNDEYHTYCLDPPLESVPSEETWYCPACQASHERRAARTSSRLRATVSSSIGTKDKMDDSPSPSRRSLSRASPSKKESDNNSTGSSKESGKPRSRSRKAPSPTPSESGGTRQKRSRSHSKPPSMTSLLKKRGRLSQPNLPSSPDKSALKLESPNNAPQGFESSTETKGIISAVIVGESQICLSKEEVASKATTNDGIAVPVVDATSTEQPSKPVSATSQSALPDVPAPVTMSRSGRPLKRSSFHDEIGQGAQHLKSSRITMELQQRRASTSSGTTAPPIQSKQTVAVTSAVSPSEPPKTTPVSLLVATKTIALQTKPGIAVATTESKATPSEVLSERPVLEASIAPEETIATPTVTLAKTGPATHSTNATSSTSFPQTSTSSPTVDAAAAAATSTAELDSLMKDSAKVPRRKPGARECMQLSRRFGSQIISETNMEILYDYCKRGKVEHLIRMRERLDDHARFLESQLAGLEAIVREKGVDEISQAKTSS